MKLVGANKYLTRREIIMAHAPILLVEGIIVPEQDKNNMMTFKGPGRNMPVIKYGFTTEKQGMVRSLNLQESEDLDFEWNGVLSAAAYGIRSTYHTTLKASPGQLVFGRDMIFNIRHVADWRAIQQRKQQVIDKNNRRENSTRIEHHYQIGDEVIMRNKSANKYEPPNIGPFEIVRVHNNGTVTLKKGAIEMQVNIRHLSPLRK